jgi:hypothetical protein
MTSDHRCFGCGKQLGDHEQHIHVGIDDWGQRQGHAPIGQGIDDVLSFAFCEACTERSRDGWQFESHEIGSEGS